MITAFTDRYIARKDIFTARIAGIKSSSEFTPTYADIVKAVVETIRRSDSYDSDPEEVYEEYVPEMDPNRITEIDHGSYEGTLVYVIAERGSRPSTYWYVMVSYGSCSACDTIQRIESASSAPDFAYTEQQLEDYYILGLHIAQKIKRMDGED
jgi:hypothetical protein